MRKLSISMMIVLIALAAFPAAAADIKTEDQKVLYALGAFISRDAEAFKLTPEELAIVQQGFADNLLGRKLAVDPKDYEDKINKLAQARIHSEAEVEKKKSVNFLDKAEKEKGAKRTKSGMVYIPVKQGSGKQPNPTSTVKVHYTGTFVDGKVFDSSVQRGTPAEFRLDGVIPCWTEGVSMMKEGGKARLVCPSYLSYGQAGRPPVIPGGATLLFEIELLEIRK